MLHCEQGVDHLVYNLTGCFCLDMKGITSVCVYAHRLNELDNVITC